MKKTRLEPLLALAALWLAAWVVSCSEDQGDGVVSVCGNGVVELGEECDDGNKSDGDNCTSVCRRRACGDGVVQEGEECDDGNLSNADECTIHCMLPRCGDGFLQGGEECDDGNVDNFDACTECVVNVCGDGVAHQGVEACDDGNTDDGDGCSALCRLTSCGDGVVQPPEKCDDGNDDNTDGCLDNCLPARCGDGVVHDGFEDCDDGNTDDHDGCTNQCTFAHCGDGIVQPPEQCDDGNASHTDGCIGCKPAFCGDGFLQGGVEECDDGNASDNDACLNDCRPASCGDGFVHTGVEACDDGNQLDTDGCTAGCALPTCGDGFLQPGEECDDKNADNTDGCLMTCVKLDLCEGFAITAVNPPSTCTSNPMPPSTLELTASGYGFLIVEGVQPTAWFDGKVVPILSMSNGGQQCTKLDGVLGDIKSCTTMVIDIPDALGIGIYDIEVENPITSKCADTTIQYGVQPAPVLTNVVPNEVCENVPAKLGFFGQSFAPTTQAWLSGPKPPLTKVTPQQIGFVNPGNLSVQFGGLKAGVYDATVSNGAQCESTLTDALKVLLNPFVFFVNPPVVYNGINTQVTVYVANINGAAINFVGVRLTNTNNPYSKLIHVYDPNKPNRVLATVPKNLPPGDYDVKVEDGKTCIGEQQAILTVTNSLTLAIKDIAPVFGWNAEDTDVTVTADNPPPPGKKSFQNLPAVFLNPADPNAIATELSAVTFQSAGEVTAVVPKGLKPGKYDVIAVNPDGAVGILPQKFEVVANQPPVIFNISPGSVPNKIVVLTIDGAGFNVSPLPAVELDCKDLNNVTKTYKASDGIVVNSSTGTVIKVTLPAGIADGSVCVVRVINPDNAFGEYSALGVTGPSENITPFKLHTQKMTTPRRAPAVTQGRANSTTRFLYACGGDLGGVASAMDSCEAIGLDKFGEPLAAGWRLLPIKLPKKITLADAKTIGRFIYLAGGNGGGGANDALSDAYRTKILDPTAVPKIVDVSVLPSQQMKGLPIGVWYYRVAAVMGSNDPYNPDGEELPSDPQAVSIPKAVVIPVDIQLDWTPIPGAKAYRVYRSPTPNLPSGNEQLLATVSGNPPPTKYVDSGGATLPQNPRVPGDTGVWVPLFNMTSARQGLALAAVQNNQNPIGPKETWYLYALGGKNGLGNVLATSELIRIGVNQNGMPTPQPPWLPGVSTFPPARWQLGSFVVDSKITDRISPTAAFVYVAGGIDGGNGVLSDVDAAPVTMTGNAHGQLGLFSAQKGISPAAAGMGHEAGANQLFSFGGVGAAASDKNTAAQICGPGSGCPPAANPPDLNNWNNNAAMAVKRYLLGTAVESAHFFLIGGHDGLAASDTMESTIW